MINLGVLDLLEEKLNKTIKLKKNKTIGYAEFGDPNGWPIFHCHGHGNSRLEGEMFDEVALNHSARLMSIDRPGYGLSEFYKRKLIDWGDDVEEIADILGIKKYSVIGISGGAAHALSCAVTSPERVFSTSIISLIGPRNVAPKTLPRSLRVIMFIATRIPILYRLMLKQQFKIQSDPSKLIEFAEKNQNNIPEGDFELMVDENFSKFYCKVVREGAKQGTKGPAYDTKVFSSNWGFDFKEIPTKPNIILWHGMEDRSFKQVKFISEFIPQCEKKFYENEGHVSIALNYSDDIFKSLIPQ